MKNSILIVLSLALMLTACNNDKNNDNVLSDAEVVEMVEATLASADEGLAKEMESAARLANEATASGVTVCDIDYDSTFAVNLQGLVREISFGYQYDWKVNCRSNTPKSMEFTANRNGTYKGPRLEYDGNGTNEFEIKDLDEGSEYTVNGSISFSANTTRVRVLSSENAEASVNIDAELKKIKVNKTTLLITSGEAKFDMEASSIVGSASYSIKVEFGNGTAEIDYNGNVTVVSL